MNEDTATPRGILFDLDGTLADTAADLAAAIDETMRRLGLEVCGLARVRGWIGGGVPELVRSALTHCLGRSPLPTELDRAVELAIESYGRHNGCASRPYPGATETLLRLRAAGRAVGCVTNKSRRFTLPLLERLGWRQMFDAIVCGDKPQTRKPRADPLHEAARQLRLGVDELVLVGDSEHDVLAARNAGMRIAVVSYGYFRGREHSELEPDAILTSLPDLFSIFPGLGEAPSGDPRA